MFHLEQTRARHLQFAVSIQKRSHADSYKINPSILLRSPFEEASPQSLLVLANLRMDGVHLHVNEESWWAPERLPQALDALKRHALRWFSEWGTATFLVKKVEASIHERKTLIDVLEPLTAEQESAIARAWPQTLRADVRAGPAIFHFASVLHYLDGNRGMAVTRTRDWLGRLGPGDNVAKGHALAQLAVLEQLDSVS
jgi:hypothetical protein